MGSLGFTPYRLDEALQYLHNYGDETTIIAGGTDVLVRYYRRLYELDRIINICELNELKNIKFVNNQIEIGSLVTHSQLEQSTIILEHAPHLADAAGTIGSPQIRNRGTIGGNVANASPAGDTISPLMSLDAKVKLVSLDRGERIIPLEEFFIGPGRHVMKKDELIISFLFPILEEDQVYSFIKLGHRKALAISTVNVAARMTLTDNKISDCRIVLGSVAPTVVRARLVEEVLLEEEKLLEKEKLLAKELTDDLITKALNQLEKDISPISDIRGSQQYRLDTAKELVSRVIRDCQQKGGRRK